jgi:hypothetical protein
LYGSDLASFDTVETFEAVEAAEYANASEV